WWPRSRWRVAQVHRPRRPPKSAAHPSWKPMACLPRCIRWQIFVSFQTIRPSHSAPTMVRWRASAPRLARPAGSLRMPLSPQRSRPTRCASLEPAGRLVSEKRLQPGLRAAQDQGVHVVGALVGVDGLEVGGVAHDMVLDLDPIAAVHIAGAARDIERLAAIVALDDGNHLRRHLAFVEQATDPERSL